MTRASRVFQVRVLPRLPARLRGEPVQPPGHQDGGGDGPGSGGQGVPGPPGRGEQHVPPQGEHHAFPAHRQGRRGVRGFHRSTKWSW